MSAIDCDILIIGGGPAGATAAALLATRGHRVSVLDKPASWRRQSAELLSPAVLPLLVTLGVASKVEAIAVPGFGIESISADGRLSQQFALVQDHDLETGPAWQVPRAAFDRILLDHARTCGATVIDDCRATHLQLSDQGGALVSARRSGESASWKTRFVLDASGRDGFIGHQLKTRKRQAGDDRMALYASFSGVPARPPQDSASSIYWFEHGSFRVTPLNADTVSVAMLVSNRYLKTRRVPVEEFLQASIALCPALAARLEQAVLLDLPQATEVHNMRCEQSSAGNYLLLGDAGVSLDARMTPGILLAMHSAVAAADTADRCLRRPAEAAGALLAYEQTMLAATRALSWFSMRGDSAALRSLLLHTPQRWGMDRALLSLLAGDTVSGRVQGSLTALKACCQVRALQAALGGRAIGAGSSSVARSGRKTAAAGGQAES